MAQKIRFTKMHGCGNDYIYVNTMGQKVPNPQEAAIRWSDRHKGIGSDGLVLIGKSPVPEADYTMHIYNADGSEAMMCGNASRCIGKYLFERGLTDKTDIRLLTLSGVKTLQLHTINNKVESVTVDMLEPVLENESQYIASRSMGRGTFVSMGNPHYVIFTDDVDQVGEHFHSGVILNLHRLSTGKPLTTRPLTTQPLGRASGSGVAASPRLVVRALVQRLLLRH